MSRKKKVYSFDQEELAKRQLSLWHQLREIDAKRSALDKKALSLLTELNNLFKQEDNFRKNNKGSQICH
jgi:hypothetical protein